MMQFSDQQLDITSPQVMGILNVTPDSFSDGGQFNQYNSAIKRARDMVSQGATFIDVGGESTRPGAADVSVNEELDRVIPVIEALGKELECVISVDTSKSIVMTEAVKAGAGLINDVRALQEPGAQEAAALSGASVCLMHMQGQPRTMQLSPVYDDVVDDVKTFLSQRASQCIQAGIDPSRIILDPGFGFGKTTEQNYTMLKRLREFNELGYPLLVGMSRKSMLGQVIERNADDRLAASISAATIAALKGAKIIRVHDVQQTVDAMTVIKAMEN